MSDFDPLPVEWLLFFWGLLLPVILLGLSGSFFGAGKIDGGYENRH